MNIYLGADHRGFELKEAIKVWLAENKLTGHDEGAFSYDQTDDYPDFTKAVAENVTRDLENGEDARGIVFCGSGVGVDITANKMPGIRCGFAHTEKQIESARSHDDINVLAVPADYLDEETVKKIIKTFLHTDFVPEDRHTRRIDKITEIEKR